MLAAKGRAPKVTFPLPSFASRRPPRRYGSISIPRAQLMEMMPGEAIHTTANCNEDGAEHHHLDDQKCDLFLLMLAITSNLVMGPYRLPARSRTVR
jgi:hypothetical protein